MGVVALSFLSLFSLLLRMEDNYIMKTESNDRKLFDNLLSKEEIAKEFGVSPKTIANWMSSGKLPCIKIGRRNMALRTMVDIWLAKLGRTRK